MSLPLRIKMLSLLPNERENSRICRVPLSSMSVKTNPNFSSSALTCWKRTMDLREFVLSVETVIRDKRGFWNRLKEWLTCHARNALRIISRQKCRAFSWMDLACSQFLYFLFKVRVWRGWQNTNHSGSIDRQHAHRCVSKRTKRKIIQRLCTG